MFEEPSNDLARQALLSERNCLLTHNSP
jgi:hypothetical protein